MRILLDTHIFLWCISDEKALSKDAREIIQEADEVYISSVSIWEIVIKVNLKKLAVDVHRAVDAISKSGYNELPINIQHAVALRNLDNQHRDPFDRMLIAQAITEPLILLTSDATLANYSDLVHLV